MDRLFQPPLPSAGKAEEAKFGLAIGDWVLIRGDGPFKGGHGFVRAFAGMAVGVDIYDQNSKACGLLFDSGDVQKA